MTLVDALTIAGLVIGPLSATGAALFADRVRRKRAERVWVFRALMANRKFPFEPERIKALALIDIDFRDTPAVISAWRTYYESLNSPMYADGKNDAANVWKRNENAMLAEMAQSLGYAQKIKYEELERAYAPKFFENNMLAAQGTSAEFLRVLKASANFGTPREPEQPG
jgi:hypothetical protein